MRPFLRHTNCFRRTINTSAAQAPKPSIDIKRIRQNPDLFSRNCINRNYPSQKDYPYRIVEASKTKHDLQNTILPSRQRLKRLEAEVPRWPEEGTKRLWGGDEMTKGELLQQVTKVRGVVDVCNEKQEGLETEIQRLAIELPNLTDPDTTVGEEPRQLGFINQYLQDLPGSSRKWKDHVTLGEEFDLIDFQSAITSTGRGFYVLTNEAQELSHALVAYASKVAKKHGFKLGDPPSLAYAHMAAACGFRPRDQNEEQQIYSIAQHERDVGKPELVNAATAEIPFAAGNAGRLFREDELPQRTAGASRCFRAEAGGRGTDTKGLYRVHEFTKVEMFTWSLSTDAAASFQKMLDIQIEILTNLGLHCQILEMPSFDLGASAYRKIDIEAWFPSRKDRNGGWGEVTSLSNCTDYQTRRMMTRVKRKDGSFEFPYTLNGTALAVPRVLMGILEMGWDEKEDGIRIPEVLGGYMGGLDVIRKKR